MEELSAKAYTLFSIGPIDVTNSMLASILVSIVILVLAYFAGRNAKLIPGSFQALAETIIESLQSLFGSVIHNGFKRVFPFIATFFIYIIVSNWFGLTPFVGQFGPVDHGHIVHLLKPSNTDLNATIAFGIVSVIGAQYYGIVIAGFKTYIKRLLSIAGAIEFVLEPTKIVSLSFRLFGNIFAGEVVLSAVATKIFPILVPLPFMIMEIGVGFLQALIFSLLTAVSISLLTSKDH